MPNDPIIPGPTDNAYFNLVINAIKRGAEHEPRKPALELTPEVRAGWQEEIDKRLEAEPMLRYFHAATLPDRLAESTIHYAELARRIVLTVEPGFERTVALRRLLESRDAVVRAILFPGLT